VLGPRKARQPNALQLRLFRGAIATDAGQADPERASPGAALDSPRPTGVRWGRDDAYRRLQMTTLKVEQFGDDLVVRLTPEAKAHLGLKAGDEVLLTRSVMGEISLAPADMDHQIRLERGRAFMRHLRSPV